MADSSIPSPAPSPSDATSREPTAPAKQPSAVAAGLTAPWRAVAALLLGLAAVNLPFSLVATMLMTDPPVSPGMLLRSLVLFSVLPALCGQAILRIFRASVARADGGIRIERPGLAVHVPCAAIEGAMPWRIPAPGPGLSLRLRSGARLATGLRTDAPDEILDLLAAGGVDTSAAREHPTIVYQRERARRGRRGPVRLLVKYLGFGALPAAVFFNAHQYIAYGGTLGQYYLYGLGPYLETATIYWGLTATFLVLYASVWRGLAEIASLLAAWLTPTHAATARRISERACTLLYYGGVPLLVVYRFLP